MASVIKGAEPFGFDGNETGVLLIHGYTGSPQGLRPWGEYLNAKEGYTVLCPRLPGHGTTPQDLATTRWEDWVGEVEMSLRGLKERCSTVVVGALSMGAGLALDLAARRPDDITALALVNSFLYTDDPRAKLVPVLGKLPLYVKGVGDDVADPSQHEIAYAKTPTKSTASMLTALAGVRERLGAVHAPALLFVSRQDHVVKTGNTQLVYDSISSIDKEIVWLEKSYHVATLDYDRDLIFERSAEFFRSRVSA
jgi:carboxylesterase